MNGLLGATVTDIAGLIGVVLYVLSYTFLQSGRLKANGYTYPMMNLMAALMVLISLSANFNLASAMIQILWIVISLVGLQRIRRSSPHSQDEIALRSLATFERSSRPLR